MANLAGIGSSHNLLNYSGLLFNKGNTRCPMSSLIGGRNRVAKGFEFVLEQHYTTGGGQAQPAISEKAALTAPNPTFVTREQKTNVCQLFQKTVELTYAKQSSMGQLSGINIAGQEPNPATELDFQISNTMQEMQNDIEYTYINGVYQNGVDDDTAYKTRGILAGILTNTDTGDSEGLSYWKVAEMLERIAANHGDPTKLIMLMDPVHVMQLNADAVSNGLTVIPNSRNQNGINITELETPFGRIGYVVDIYVPKGTVLFENIDVVFPVELPVPGKGNFFLEPLAKKGASEAYQIYGQLGLDYGPEWFHGKITGLATTFTAPTYSRKVFVVNGSTSTDPSNP